MAAPKPAKRQIVHTKPVVHQASLGDLKNSPHFHFCKDRECRLIYEDNCADVTTNGLCQACRGQRRLTISVRDAQECCLDNCVQVLEKEHLVRYSLAGPGPWYQCRTCRRAHGWPCTT